jgi:chromosome segregation ATPase
MKKLSVSLEKDHVADLEAWADAHDLGSKSAAFRHILDEYDSLRTENDDIRTECDNLRTELDEVRTECDEVKSDRDRLDGRVDELEEQLEEKNARIEELEEALDDRPSRDHVADLEEQLDEQADRIEDLEGEVDSLEARNTDLTNQLAEANTRIDTANEIVEYVDSERTAQERWREAGILEKARYTLFGVPSDEGDDEAE